MGVIFGELTASVPSPLHNLKDHEAAPHSKHDDKPDRGASLINPRLKA